MTFRLADRSEFPDSLAGWPLPPEPLFIGSDQYDKLIRDLGLFVNGEVLGRSYLVAGHRGAGKTALVIRAVQDLRTSILRESVKEAPQLAPQANGLERPLIVKLHGPSLLRTPDPAPAAQPAPAAGAAAGAPAAAGARAGTGGQAAGPPPAAAPVRPAPLEDAAHAALVQITVGLYRALAAEAALGFEVHARSQRRPAPGDSSELAAQLALELDGGPDPASLRRYWAAIGRLADGILWPPSADDTLKGREVGSQGYREIIAIATAAQAFQVCTGQVTYDTTVLRGDVAVSETKAEASSDLKDVIARVSTLGIGALTGVSVAGAPGAGPVAAVGAGLAVWLIGNFSLNWSVTRTRTNDQKVNYSFIRDRTVTTLDRDLPLVIKRVREAGLAPVFVIDELDKVKDARTRVTELVYKLKHLVTDYGFFCFLVNRDLFDEIEERVERLPYPVDHTYFSERLLVRAEPNRILVYLGRLLQDESPSATRDLARTVFALAVMHRAKFNLVDLIRAVADVAGSGDSLRMSESDLTSQRQLFVATVQIAINEILRQPGLSERMRADSSYAQLVVDTLYYPSRCWERGDKIVAAAKANLAEYLKNRMSSEDSSGAGGEGPSESDLDQLHGLLIQLLDDLAAFPALKSRLENRLVFDPPVLAGLSPEIVAKLPRSTLLKVVFPSIEARESLLVAPRDRSFKYRFLFDSQGERIRPSQPSWSDEQVAAAKSLLATVKSLEALLKSVGTDIEELADSKLLPPIAGQADFAAARRHVEASVKAQAPGASASTDLERLRRLADALDERGAALGTALSLIASVARDSRAEQGVLPRIARLVDFTRPAEGWLDSWTPPPQPLGSAASDLDRWRTAIGDKLLPEVDASALGGIDRYGLLGERLPRYFEAGEKALGPFRYEELVLAARDEAPYRYLRTDAEAMLARDWSGLALQAMPRTVEAGQVPIPARAPYWVLVAALRGLGFGQSLLSELADPDLTADLIKQGWLLQTHTLSVARCMDLAREIAAGAPPAESGVLLIRSDEDAASDPHLPSRRRPTLLVGETESSHYVSSLLWLGEMEAFAGLADDEGSSDEVQAV